LIFGVFYSRGSAKAYRDDAEKKDRITALMEDEKGYRHKLIGLEKERKNLFENIKLIKEMNKEQRKQASTTEEELFDEIISLEAKLKDTLEHQQAKEQELMDLKNRLNKNRRKLTGKSKRKNFDFAVKRFTTLYKNLEMNRRAVSTFFELSDDQQIKAEEIIHQLNDDPGSVAVKRKVFLGKKHKVDSFEILFSYNGRLYFRKRDGKKVEILTIGTKNTQDKDMEFLQKL